MNKQAYEASVRMLMSKKAAPLIPVSGLDFSRLSLNPKPAVDTAKNIFIRYKDRKAGNPIEYMRSHGRTDQYRNEALNAIEHYVRTGNYQLSPGGAVYMASLARGADPEFQKALSQRLNTYAGTLKDRAALEEYHRRMAGIQEPFQRAMGAQGSHLLGLQLTTEHGKSKFKEGLTKNLTPAITGAYGGSLSQVFSGKNGQGMYDAYHSDDYRQGVMNNTLEGIRRHMRGEDHGLTNYQVAQHALMYHNNQDYRDAFNKEFQGWMSEGVTDSMTPDQLRVMESRFRDFNVSLPDNFMSTLSPEEQLQLAASNRGNINPDTKAIMDTNITGLTNAATAGVKSGLWKNGTLWKNPTMLREWALYASEKGMIPEWFGSLAQNKELFWGAVATGGALAVGGVVMLVKSFLNSRDEDKHQKQQQQVPPGYMMVPRTTSLWRADAV